MQMGSMVMRLILRAVLAASAMSIPLLAGPAIAAGTPKPLFASDDIISFTLSGPLNGISRKDTAKPVPGILKLNGSVPEELPVELSTRGITRRRADVCDFPPLRVQFTKKPGPDSLFKGQKSLKLVTHCKSAEKFQQDVFLEYAAYRIYNALTPASFNARLAKIDYEGQNGTITRYGYFLEDIDDVAQRNGQRRFRGVNHISSSQLDSAAAARFAVFQDLISNLDWAMTANVPGEDCCHNSRLLGAKRASTGLVTVPYDFDLSGLVDAPYALPPAGINVSNVRVRLYRGFCADNDQAQAFAASLSERRVSIIAILDQTPQLSDSNRKKADDYLGAFFDQIGSPAKIAGLLKTCLRPVP
jgi:hypothetical protein